MFILKHETTEKFQKFNMSKTDST